VKTGRPSLSGVDIYMSWTMNKETTLYWRLTECSRDTQVLKYLWWNLLEEINGKAKYKLIKKEVSFGTQMGPRQIQTLALNEFCAINNNIPERILCHCDLNNTEFENRNISTIQHSWIDQSSVIYQTHFKLVWDSYQHLMTVGEQKSVKLI
jgi:hypothetical protein